MQSPFMPTTGVGVPRTINGIAPVGSFRDGPAQFFELPYTIRGVTNDGTGTPLASCPVRLFRTADDSLAGQVTSDAVTGAYRIDASPTITHYAVAYHANAPDTAGTTVNTIVGTPD